MNTQTVILALAGGGLIGLAASLLLLASGRIAGISGILGGTLMRPIGDTAWRLWFLAGLVVGGLVVRGIAPSALPLSYEPGIWLVVAAGLLVGFGTRLGSGCTSGHGVCGIGRLSPRSLVATVTFIAAGAITVALVH